MNERNSTDEDLARSVFAGLVPRIQVEPEPPSQRSAERSRLTKTVFSTGSVLLVGSMAAMTFNLSGPVDRVEAKDKDQPTDTSAEVRKGVRQFMAARQAAVKPVVQRAAAVSAPASYRVQDGDTISDIAGRFGLSTAAVLAKNGLDWSSLIFPGQELSLSGVVTASAPTAAKASAGGTHTIVAGDTISDIAHHYGVSTVSVLTANGLGWSSIIYPGQVLSIPGLHSESPATVPADESDLDIDLVDSAAPIEAVPEEQVAEAVETDEPADTDAESSKPADKPKADDADDDSSDDSGTEDTGKDDSGKDSGTSDDDAKDEKPEKPVVEDDDEADEPTVKGTTYTIVSGDTIGKIASKFGISVQSLLDANGLTLSSTIYAGRTLKIPGDSTTASTGDTITQLTSEMRANAETIIEVGYNLDVPDYGIVIALATAMQESGLRNLDWGDRDSVGLFQQRPSTGWGTVAQLTKPSYAAKLFYGGPSNPNKGNTRGLLDISGWQKMTVTQAAQKVQISGHPDAYAKWEASARAWFSDLG